MVPPIAEIIVDCKLEPSNFKIEISSITVPVTQNKTANTKANRANHNGSLDLAVKTIEAAARAGADAVKLQTYRADTITLNSNDENFIIKSGSLWDGLTYYQLYDKAHTPWQWHKTLKETAEKSGLILNTNNPGDRNITTINYN